MIIADTDVLIDALRGKELAKRRIDLELQTGSLATTAVNAFELRSGARTEAEQRRVGALLDAMTIVPLDDLAAVAAAKLRLQLEGVGQKIGMADYLIAGICLSKAAVLLTRNKAHFERVPGLKLSADFTA